MNKLHLKIGTSSSNELVLEYSGIDPHHLELFCDVYGNVFITDLKSKNGTFVNDQQLNGFKLLGAGDKVRLGKIYIFDWENFVLNANFGKKQEGSVQSVAGVDKPKPIPNPIPVLNPTKIPTSKSIPIPIPIPKPTPILESIPTSSSPTSLNSNFSDKMNDSSKINRELFFIYGLILVVIALMFIVL